MLSYGICRKWSTCHHSNYILEEYLMRLEKMLQSIDS